MRGPSRARKIRGSPYATPLLHQDLRLPDERVRLRPHGGRARRRRRLDRHRRSGRGRRSPHEHLLGAREGAGEGVLAARASGARSRQQRPRGHHRRRRLCREPGGRGHHRARAVRRPRVRPADAASPAADDRGAAPHRARAGRCQLSRRSRNSITCPRRAPRARAPSSRSWRAAASTAASASCPTRAARKSAGRSTRCSTEVRALAARACAK